MRVFRNIGLYSGLLVCLCYAACSSPEGLKKSLVGKYASEGEDEYDNFRDTLEIRLLDNGNFDVQTIAHWSAAKMDNPLRPNENKKAGEWHSYGQDRTEVATLQASDTTLRITDPLTGQVKRIFVKSQGKTLEKTSRSGVKKVYHKVS
ncbi:hypothetical protein SAMN06265348_107291 [Pedobacter westerhofensis]|uniref:Lipocalin-like domain-containing protein n=1 Tax=Pedobacter westerhofensis TaxID=425512 RepID=A0A521EC87_9SPHI|nr:hypothetical protein [Pedobacter westerhofensis]SMO80790.1 hypothetical protein SAMN06265348_107291 [Pedobacter westerhofensis]